MLIAHYSLCIHLIFVIVYICEGEPEDEVDSEHLKIQLAHEADKKSKNWKTRNPFLTDVIEQLDTY